VSTFYAAIAPFLLQISEFILVIAVGGLIFFSLRRGSTSSESFDRLQCAFSRLARRRNLSILVVGLLVLVTRAALVPVLGVPAPRWNDEYSYLLAADTFAHGRLTNPTHPMWIHFESFHIIEHPTYMSMYPPAQGMVLALGEVLGCPWIGQLLITALMCSALCWMLQGRLPAGWALFGALLAVLRLGILSYWMNTYWCASVAALGGALVFGAWIRLQKDPRTRYGVLLGLGLIILANSRPYEGFILGLPVAVAMLHWLLKKKSGSLAWRVVLPIILVLGAGAAATGYYYWRVTGSPFQLTYEVNRRTYATAPYFLWETPRPEPSYHHVVMRDFYRWELARFVEYRTLGGAIRRNLDKLYSLWQFYLGPLLTVPLIALPRVLRDRRMRFPLLAGAFFAVGLAVQTWTMPHYVSPATCLIYLVLLQCMRHIRLFRWKARAVGFEMVRAIPVIACAMIVLRVGAAAAHVHIESEWPRGNLDRVRIIRQLDAMPGDHLVIVRYGPHHDADREWVYNAADIDGSRIVWARDMGEKENEELRRYFHTRSAWVINGDVSPPQLRPYCD